MDTLVGLAGMTLRKSMMKCGQLSGTTKELMPSVYDDLIRRAIRMVGPNEFAHQWNAAELVHETYLRLVRKSGGQRWESRQHFFAAAVITMRRLLIESARHKSRIKRGGDWKQIDRNPDDIESQESRRHQQRRIMKESVEGLAQENAQAAQILQLKCFRGLSVEAAGLAVGLSRAHAYRQWQFALDWLAREL